jgi:hypothetical protein
MAPLTTGRMAFSRCCSGVLCFCHVAGSERECIQKEVGRTACPAGELIFVFEAFGSANTNEEFNPDDAVSYWEFCGWPS